MESADGQRRLTAGGFTYSWRMDASRAGTLVVVDDASLRFPLLRKYWRIHVAIGSIHELACIQLNRRGVTHNAKGWCIGRVQPWAVTDEGRARRRTEFAALLPQARRDEVLRRYRARSPGPILEPSLKRLYRAAWAAADEPKGLLQRRYR